MKAPALNVLQPALRSITETLAHALANPDCGAPDATPDWTETEWLLARAVASIHVFRLCCRRSCSGMARRWKLFLDGQRTQTATRHAHLLVLQDNIHRKACGEGIQLAVLKGAALHALGIYQSGERPMADIDLLAQPCDAVRTARILEDLGFRQTFVTWKHQAFEPRERSCARGARRELCQLRED